MNISAFRSALILIIFTISMTASAGEKFYVRADSVRIEHDNVRLKMSVWNCSESPVNTQLAYLPWGEHAIPTNSSVTNEINLSRLFPKLSGYKYMKDVVIFWVYDKGLLDHSSSNYVGGMIQVLPTNQIFTSPSNPCK